MKISMYSCLQQYMEISSEHTALFISRERTSGSNRPVVVRTDLVRRGRQNYLPLSKADMWRSVTYQFQSNE